MAKARRIPIERNNLPEIHRRRQGGGSVKFGKFDLQGRNKGWKNRELLPVVANDPTVKRWQDTWDFSFQFDNPEYSDTTIINGELHWARAEYSNLDATSRFVVNHNHSHRSSARHLGLYAKAYAETLYRLFNLCYRCMQPVKVKRVFVPRGASLEEVNEVIKEKSRKTGKRSISLYNDKGEVVSSFPRQGAEFNATTHMANVTYCDLRPHYEVRSKPDGNLMYVFVDGTEIDKLVKVTRGYFDGVKSAHLVERKEYTLLDGTPLPNYCPPVTYRAFNVHCTCGAVRPK